MCLPPAPQKNARLRSIIATYVDMGRQRGGIASRGTLLPMDFD